MSAGDDHQSGRSTWASGGNSRQGAHTEPTIPRCTVGAHERQHLLADDERADRGQAEVEPDLQEHDRTSSHDRLTTSPIVEWLKGRCRGLPLSAKQTSSNSSSELTADAT